MMNRFSGLLFAKSHLSKNELSTENLDFINRNIAKAQLAIGDALLTANGKYHWSCIQRLENLKNLKVDHLPISTIIHHHQKAVEFKLHPKHMRKTKDQLSKLHEEVSALAWHAWKHIESIRLDSKITDPESYIHQGNKCPETNPIKNILLRFRTFGFSSWMNKYRFRYPREALLNTLTLLLWKPEAADLKWLSTTFCKSIESPEAALVSYKQLWENYN